MISPWSPSDTTSSEPKRSPVPIGGPYTIPGIRSCPNPALRPGVKETTRVMKQSVSSFRFTVPICDVSLGGNPQPITDNETETTATIRRVQRCMTCLPCEYDTSTDYG